jgi:NADPH:quinone reductase-like Zn-dependent oxidoreductase
MAVSGQGRLRAPVAASNNAPMVQRRILMALAAMPTFAALRIEVPDDAHPDASSIARPGRGELLVHVRAAGIRFRGRGSESPREARTLASPPAWRSGMAGVVQSVGEGVAGFAVGDEIFGVMKPRQLRAGDTCAPVSAGRVARRAGRSHTASARR